MSERGQLGRILLVGAGGLGSPAALVLARNALVGTLTVLDDEAVDETNLHRQTLFTEEQLGQPKSLAAATRLTEEARAAGHRLQVEAQSKRLLPDTALELVRSQDVVVEGSDNFATKFLTADACALAGVPAVQAGAVRWNGWALGAVPGRSACLRCVFEDIPRDEVETCAEAGVVGPVVGVLGALQAAIALRLLVGEHAAAGVLWSYRALEGRLGQRRVRPRPGCPLCAGEIRDLRVERYAATCAA